MSTSIMKKWDAVLLAVIEREVEDPYR